MHTQPVCGADFESFTMMSNCATYPGHTSVGTEGSLVGLMYTGHSWAPIMASHQFRGCFGSVEVKPAALTMTEPSSNWALPVWMFGFMAVCPHSLCSEYAARSS